MQQGADEERSMEGGGADEMHGEEGQEGAFLDGFRQPNSVADNQSRDLIFSVWGEDHMNHGIVYQSGGGTTALQDRISPTHTDDVSQLSAAPEGPSAAQCVANVDLASSDEPAEADLAQGQSRGNLKEILDTKWRIKQFNIQFNRAFTRIFGEMQSRMKELDYDLSKIEADDRFKALVQNLQNRTKRFADKISELHNRLDKLIGKEQWNLRDFI